MFPIILATVALALGQLSNAATSTTLKTINVDPLNNATSMHQTEVGAVSGSNGFVQVSSMLVGRNFGDGAPAMGVSIINGRTVRAGLLPGLTKYQSPAGPYDAVSFPSVAWNAASSTWLVSVLPITGDPNGGDQTHTPVVLRSQDGMHWSAPIPVGPDLARPEKNLLACDNNYFTSPHFGSCYVVWDDNDNNDLFHANVSTDGGKTWGPTQTAADGHSAYGAFPVVQPNGRVVVTSEDISGYDSASTNLISLVSADGGATWSGATLVTPITAHPVAGSMRTQPLPSSVAAANGLVYTVWQDCRFRANCSSNDIVLSTSADGTTWTAPARIPLDSVSSSVDHFLPALSVSNSFFGTELALSYYFFPQTNCTTATCALYAATSISYDGGRHWTAPAVLAGPMNLGWLPLTSVGYMVGDYFTNVISGGRLFDPLVVASAPTGSVFHEATYLPVSCDFFGCGGFAGIAPLDRAQQSAAAVMPDRTMLIGRPQPPRAAAKRFGQHRHSPM